MKNLMKFILIMPALFLIACDHTNMTRTQEYFVVEGMGTNAMGEQPCISAGGGCLGGIYYQGIRDAYYNMGRYRGYNSGFYNGIYNGYNSGFYDGYYYW